MIALEGPDNAGKSTLAKYLCDRYGLALCTAGPAPKNERERDICLITQYANSGWIIVQDRLTCISQQIYNDLDHTEEETFLQSMIKVEKFVLVYCRPPDRTLMDFSTHSIKSYDTEESLAKIIANQHKYIEKYDAIMKRIPHVWYDWTDSNLNIEYITDILYNSQISKEGFHDLSNLLSISGYQYEQC